MKTASAWHTYIGVPVRIGRSVCLSALLVSQTGRIPFPDSKIIWEFSKRGSHLNIYFNSYFRSYRLLVRIINNFNYKYLATCTV